MRFIVFLFFAFPMIMSAQIKEELILKGKDSIFLRSRNLSFDVEGNYCLAIALDDAEYLYTQNDTLGPLRFLTSIFGRGGSITTYEDVDFKGEEQWYYKNDKGTSVFGPQKGRLESFTDSGTPNNLAVSISYSDSIYHFINGKKIKSIPFIRKRELNEISDYYSFSSIGHYIYSNENYEGVTVIADGKIIAKHNNEIYAPMINDNGYYLYGDGRKGLPDEKYDYLFFINTPTLKLGPVRTLWNHYLNNDNGYFYNGDDNGPEYIAVNDKLFKNIYNIENITLFGKSNFLFTCIQDKKSKINVNGIYYEPGFEEIFLPAIDTVGNFACFGIQDFYLYKYINGKKINEPITRDNVRATPLYISPTGTTLHYFDDDERVKVFRDNEILFDIINTKFSILTLDEIFESIDIKTNNGHTLFYMEIDDKGYIVYNGELSKSMLPVTGKAYYSAENGNIVNGKLCDNGFFAIQKLGEKSFNINVNNNTYYTLHGVDTIIKGNCYLLKDKLIFYGIKEESIYKYTVKL